jgi:hypothetical protein
MSLSADPSVTMGTTAGALSSQSLAASGTQNFIVDFSATQLGGYVQIGNKPGASVSTTTGVLVQAFNTCDGTTYDTIPFGGVNFVITSAASTQQYQSLFLPTGKFKILLTNQDATFATTIQATISTVA